MEEKTGKRLAAGFQAGTGLRIGITRETIKKRDACKLRCQEARDLRTVGCTVTGWESDDCKNSEAIMQACWDSCYEVYK